jgi:serine/threonine protein kinase/formylglycine-generating enzyme required for sulfatase activity
VDAQQQVAEACTRFDRAWHAGERPRIEDYLFGNRGTEEQRELFRDLLEIEIFYRSQAGEAFDLDEYLARFGEQADLVRKVFSEQAGSVRAAGDPGENTVTVAAAEAGPTGRPAFLGRYRITGDLGSGSYGVVYKACDDDLGRDVAIKVPHHEIIELLGGIDAYLKEARVVASLKHPHIVPVHDIGYTADGRCHVVYEFIDGSDLKTRLKSGRGYGPADAAGLVATLADALAYAHAHENRIKHRDIKPANILIDRSDRPYLTDFGLAHLDEDYGKGPAFAGSVSYMSPEQARRESHRVDGRSDIFSLGIVFYELLTGRRPFEGTRQQILDRIARTDVAPPRQLAPALPAELERICLKAVARQLRDRYSTAADLAADLRAWLADNAAAPSTGGAVAPKAEPAPCPANGSGSHLPVSIVPRGLHSFDARDAEFFLELLPGSRERDGLPRVVHFWKTRLECTDPERTFPIGLLYGPSGCGKSSLVKAGLLPRLGPDVLPVYVEATPEETEARLLRGLHRTCPALEEGIDLVAAVDVLRRGRGLSRGQKVVMVLDQFEQWLHGRRPEENAPLVHALRHCDGARVQALVLVRDDFWMAVTRFFRDALEVPLREDDNSAAVDLFDLRHARKVLAGFGRAYGALPLDTSPDEEQACFLDAAVEGLAEDGRIIPVRLALFAEMVKARAWVPATLRAIGGVGGVGVTFLEETFSATTAPPTHRLHQQAVRAILRALLPEAGANIKGQMQPVQRLQEVSGYGARSRDFDDLLRILDGELRLITPTEPEGREEGGGMRDKGSKDRSDSSVMLPPSSLRYYQLTHDFLVPAIREWLTRKQRETPAGRAQLLLAERAALWAAKPEAKQLPSLLEWLTIVGRTDRTHWSISQQKLMRAASRRLMARLAAGLAALAAVAVLVLALYALWHQRRQEEWASHLVNQLLLTDVTRVAEVAEQLDGLPGTWRARLERMAGDDSSPHAERLRAHMVLVRDHPGSVAFLVGQLLEARPAEFKAILGVLQPQKERCRDTLWPIAADPASAADRRFHAAVALADLDPESEQWPIIAAPAAAALVRVDLLLASEWTRSLQPVRKHLLKPLVVEYSASDAPEARRILAAGILADYAADEPGLLARLLEQADPPQFRSLFPAVKAHSQRCVEIFQAVAASGLPAGEGDLRLRKRARANAAAALMLLNHPEAVYKSLGRDGDPDVRTMLVDLLPSLVDFDLLWSVRDKPGDDLGRQSVLLALDSYRAAGKLSTAEKSRLEARLGEIFLQDESAAVHSAAEWLLRRLGRADRVQVLTDQLAGKRRSDWCVSPGGHTLAVIRGPVEFQIGSPPDEPRRDGGEDRSRWRIPYTYQIGTHEVTVAQFKKFFPDHRYAGDVARTLDCPMNYVSWYDVARFCRRLSEEEKIPEDEMVFPPVEQIRADKELILPRNWLRRSGYRWPTEAEWEFACRGGTTTRRFFGALDDALPMYGWWQSNAAERCWPVGSLRPNPFGLFDVYGNVGEWCFNRRRAYSESAAADDESERTIRPGTHRVFRGATFQQMSKDLRSAKRDSADPATSFSHHGFRIARTAPSDVP